METITRTNEATNESETLVIADLSINQIRDILAADYNIELPKSWKRAQIVEILVAALEDRADVFEQYIVKANDTHGSSKDPIALTAEQLAERVKQHRENLDLDEAERLRKAAEKSKPKRRAFEVSVEELNTRSSKIGYAVGVLHWALNRIAKETIVANQVSKELGDRFDLEASALTREALATGFVKAFDQFRFPSKACASGAEGVKLVNLVISEIWDKADPSTNHREVLGLLGANTLFEETLETLFDNLEGGE